MTGYSTSVKGQDRVDLVRRYHLDDVEKVFVSLTLFIVAWYV